MFVKCRQDTGEILVLARKSDFTNITSLNCNKQNKFNNTFDTVPFLKSLIASRSEMSTESLANA